MDFLTMMKMERDRSPINDMPQGSSDDDLYAVDEDLPFELKAMFKKTCCHLCKAPFTSILACQQHYVGKAHNRSVRVWKYSLTKNVSNTDTQLFCAVCNLAFSSPKTAESHQTGRKHKRAISLLVNENKMVVEEQERRFGIGDGFKPDPDPVPPTTPTTPGTGPANYRCDTCVVFCPNDAALQAHLAGSKHKKKLAVANGELGNGVSPKVKMSPLATRDLVQRIKNVNLNCCDTTFADIVDLVEHLRSEHQGLVQVSQQ